MKLFNKIFLSFFTIVFLFFTSWEVSAIKVVVTEKIPWLECTASGSTTSCDVWVGFAWVLTIMWWIIKYFTFLAALWGVLFIVINGLKYSMSWLDQGLKDEAKKNIVWTLIGLILLLLSWFILNIIAPWVYK